MRSHGRLRHNIQGSQKQRLRAIIVYSTLGAATLLTLVILFNMSSHRVKASDIDIQQAKEQVFFNDMNVPAPFYSQAKQAGPNTIFIQQAKPVSIQPQEQ